MAFFLLLWLLSTSSEETLKGLAEYFSESITQVGPPGGVGGALQGLTVVPDAVPRTPASPVDLQPTAPLRRTDREERQELELGRTEAADRGEGGEAAEGRDGERFEAAKAAIEQALSSVPELQRLKESLVFDRTPEGLRIQIVDREQYAMFPLGSDVMYPHTRRLLAVVAQAVRDMPNRLSIRGHTDARPFAPRAGYDNWRLSSDRAHATRQALLEAGLDPGRIAEVVGRADADPLFPADPYDPRNRRISLVLLHDRPPGRPGRVGGERPGSPGRPPRPGRPARGERDRVPLTDRRLDPSRAATAPSTKREPRKSSAPESRRVERVGRAVDGAGAGRAPARRLPRAASGPFGHPLDSRASRKPVPGSSGAVGGVAFRVGYTATCAPATLRSPPASEMLPGARRAPDCSKKGAFAPRVEAPFRRRRSGPAAARRARRGRTTVRWGLSGTLELPGTARAQPWRRLRVFLRPIAGARGKPIAVVRFGRAGPPGAEAARSRAGAAEFLAPGPPGGDRERGAPAGERRLCHAPGHGVAETEREGGTIGPPPRAPEVPPVVGATAPRPVPSAILARLPPGAGDEARAGAASARPVLPDRLRTASRPRLAAVGRGPRRCSRGAAARVATALCGCPRAGEVCTMPTSLFGPGRPVSLKSPVERCRAKGCPPAERRVGGRCGPAAVVVRARPRVPEPAPARFGTRGPGAGARRADGPGSTGRCVARARWNGRAASGAGCANQEVLDTERRVPPTRSSRLAPAPRVRGRPSKPTSWRCPPRPRVPGSDFATVSYRYRKESAGLARESHPSSASRWACGHAAGANPGYAAPAGSAR